MFPPLCWLRPPQFAGAAKLHDTRTGIHHFHFLPFVAGDKEAFAPMQRSSDRLGMIGLARVNQFDFHQGWLGAAGFGTQTGTRNIPASTTDSAVSMWFKHFEKINRLDERCNRRMTRAWSKKP
jgi:hypothetical protein